MENILLRRPTTPIVISLADFETASRIDGSRINSICGTLQYMAPEMIELILDEKSTRGYGKPVDMWALGIISFSLISGGYPFPISVYENDPRLLKSVLKGDLIFGQEWIGKTTLGRHL